MKYRIKEIAGPCGQPVYMVQGLVGLFRKEWVDLTLTGLPAHKIGRSGAALATPFVTRAEAERAIVRFAGL
ncbi:hypothetical protein LWU92_21870 [Enterobacter hormaechei]|nr:hypothetical protein [Enterobacter hormaechei]MCE1315807.1 hypothetical protein [Enterobacter hormaechei]QVJ82394.1 hypothetical protein JK004_37 [Cronobacter phage JK004]